MHEVPSLQDAVSTHIDNPKILEFSLKSNNEDLGTSMKLRTLVSCRQDIRYANGLGNIRFLSSPSTQEDNVIVIHCIILNKSYRRKGLFSSMIDMLIEDIRVSKIIICGIQSIEMEKALAKINTKHEIKFKDHGSDGIWSRNEHYCDCHNPDQLLTY